jgi:hypothetical protein
LAAACEWHLLRQMVRDLDIQAALGYNKTMQVAFLSRLPLTGTFFESRSHNMGSQWHRASLIGLILSHSILLAWEAVCHSPTFNEPGHLAAGISYWQFGRFDIYRVNPPLAKLVAAAPVVLSRPLTDWRKFSIEPGARPEFVLGEDFVAANGERTFWLITLARWACIPFSVVGGCVCYRWANELYGAWAGLFALSLWSFCPNIIAHGHLITSDAAATGVGCAACYTFWRWLKQPTWLSAISSGLLLGMAELTKTTLVVLYPVWPLIWFVYRWPDRSIMSRHQWSHELVMLSVRFLVTVYVVNLGYAFEGTGTLLRDYKFVSKSLGSLDASGNVPEGGSNRFSETWLGAFPVPLPENYVLGIDVQKRDFENYSQPSYLRERFQDRGWWYYYIYALAVKVPLGTWLLIGIAANARLRGWSRASWRDEFVLLCPAAVIFVFVSSQSGFSQHMRYVLPVFPFMFVWIGSVAKVFESKRLFVKCLVVGALTWSVATSLWVYPHSLSYFNELAGGPQRGRRHLIHSNIDWGQDLLYLRAWCDKHPEAKPLKLAYFGGFDPRHAGIEYLAPTAISSEVTGRGDIGRIPPGWYAISVNFLQGMPCDVYRGDGTRAYLSQDALIAFQDLEPVAMAGYSIYIYHVPEVANRVAPTAR